MANFTRTTYTGIPADEAAMRTAIVNAFTAAGYTLSTVTLSSVIYYYQNGQVIPSSSRTSCYVLKFDDTLGMNAASWLQWQQGESFNTGTGAVTGGIGWTNSPQGWGSASTANTETVVINSFAPDMTDNGRFRWVVATIRNGSQQMTFFQLMPYIGNPSGYNSSTHNLTVAGSFSSTSSYLILGNITTSHPFTAASADNAGTKTTSNIYPWRESIAQAPTYLWPIFVIYDGNGAGNQRIPIGTLGANIAIGSGTNATYLLADSNNNWICIGTSGASGALFLKIA
jgi:hypothetical protein